MKITILTVVYNGEKYLEDCLRSVLGQTYPDIEYLVIDGGSTDGTIELLGKYKDRITKIVSEKDNGLYDAMNKGLALATGEIIGFVHADDMLADKYVIERIAALFKDPTIDGVYGDLDYIDATSLKIVRKWRSKQHVPEDMASGWMPAHPTVYLRKRVYQQSGNFSLNFGTAADYEFMLRAFYAQKIKAIYLPLLIIKMRLGGQSNVKANLFAAYRNDLRAARKHHLPFPLFAVLLKKLRKILQFI